MTLSKQFSINASWPSKVKGGLTVSDFHIAWEQEQVTCPAKKTSIGWRVHQQGKHPQDYILGHFSSQDCQACTLKALCTRSDKRGRRLHVHPQAQFEALKKTRDFMASDQGQQAYRIRAGVAGTIAQAVNAFGGRRSRYRGQAKTHLQQAMIASAINIVRLDNFLQDKPKGKTYVSRFARLKHAA